MAVLIPGFPLLKEWAYAGFTFMWIAAVVALYLAGDGAVSLLPVVLLGALAVLALFAVIIVRGLRLTAKIEEPFDQYLAFGLTVLIGLQALIHMGVVMGLMPTKGLVLPFISYGGSAMVINLMEAGILLGLSRRRL